MANYYVSSVAYAAVQTWAAIGASQAVSLGAFVRQTSPATGNERVFKCTTAGNTGTSEPSWGLTYGQTTLESGHGGTAVWTCGGGQEAYQSAGNWTAPMARLSQLPSGSNAQASHPITFGDKVFVSSDHAETQAASVNLGPNVSDVSLLSVSRTGATLPPTSTDLLRGASVTVSAGGLLLLNTSNDYWWGIDFIGNTGSVQIRNNASGYQTFENCSFQTSGSGQNIQVGVNTNTPGAVVWDNTYAKFGGSPNVGIVLAQCVFEWRNTTSAVQGSGLPSNLFDFNVTANSKVLIHGVDLSAVTNNLFYTGTTTSSDIMLRDCKLNNGVAICGTANSGWNGLTCGSAQIMVDNCDDTTNARNYRTFRSNCYGAVQQTTALVRTGGMTDGVTQFSWQILTLTAIPQTLGNPARFQELAQRYNTTGSSKTLTLYGISSFSSIPTNANTWIDVDYLGSSASPISSLVSSRVADALAAGTNLTADTSSWNGNVSARVNSHAYVAGALISVADNTAGCTFICIGAGTSASSEPGGYAGAVDGGSVTDGGASFRAMWRWKITVTFTPQMAGTVKCNVKTLGANTMTPTANLFVIDPQFTIT